MTVEAALARRAQQRRFERVIDQIIDAKPLRQPSSCEIERRHGGNPAIPSGRGVDDRSRTSARSPAVDLRFARIAPKFVDEIVVEQAETPPERKRLPTITADADDREPGPVECAGYRRRSAARADHISEP